MVRRMSLLVKIGMMDNAWWIPHQVTGLFILNLNSGPKRLLGSNPSVRRSVLGTVVDSDYRPGMPPTYMLYQLISNAL